MSADELEKPGDERMAISTALEEALGAAKTATKAAELCIAATERARVRVNQSPGAGVTAGREKRLRLAGRAELCAQLLAETSEKVTSQASVLAAMRAEIKTLRVGKARADERAAAAQERAERLMVRWERTMMLLDRAKLDKTIAHLHTEVDKEQINELNNLRTLAREHFQSMGQHAMATAMDSLSSVDEVDSNATERTLERLRTENAIHQAAQLREAAAVSQPV